MNTPYNPYNPRLGEVYIVRAVPTARPCLNGLVRSIGPRVHSLTVAHDGTSASVGLLVAVPTIVSVPTVVTNRVGWLWGIRQVVQDTSAEVVLVIIDTPEPINLTGFLEVSGLVAVPFRHHEQPVYGDIIAVDFRGQEVRAAALSLAA